MSAASTKSQAESKADDTLRHLDQTIAAVHGFNRSMRLHAELDWLDVGFYVLEFEDGQEKWREAWEKVGKGEWNQGAWTQNGLDIAKNSSLISRGLRGVAGRINVAGEYSPPLDPGIASAVHSLVAAGVETFESCEGGHGHAYPVPTVRFHGGTAEGLKALSVAIDAGLPVAELRRTWPVIDGEPTGPYWELTFVPRNPETGKAKNSHRRVRLFNQLIRIARKLLLQCSSH